MVQDFDCPLLHEAIDEGTCYDIQMVLSKYIVPTAVKFSINTKLANLLCPTCPFNQLLDDSQK